MSRKKRIGFATIGQSPRVDIVPAIIAGLGVPVEVIEAGTLDGLDDEAIGRLTAQPGEYSFATRLADGRQVIIGKGAAEERLAVLLGQMDKQGLDLIVVLCAGTQLPSLVHTLLVEPQHIVDGVTAALAANVRTLGVVVPLEEQVDCFHLEGEVRAQVRVAFASPYVGDRFERAGLELAGCDLVVMHCMGYNPSMKEKVARAARAPTLLASQLVADVLRQVVGAEENDRAT